jgi:hypothetical protein
LLVQRGGGISAAGDSHEGRQLLANHQVCACVGETGSDVVLTAVFRVKISSEGVALDPQLALYLMRHGAGWRWPSPSAWPPLLPPPPPLPPRPPSSPLPPFPPGLCDDTADRSCREADGEWTEGAKQYIRAVRLSQSAAAMFDRVADDHEAKYGLKQYVELRETSTGRDRNGDATPLMGLPTATDIYAGVRPFTSAPYTHMEQQERQDTSEAPP